MTGSVPFRFVPKGQEKFPDNVDEIWKKNHPEQISDKGVPGWSCWAGTPNKESGSGAFDLDGSLKRRGNYDEKAILAANRP